MSSWAVAALPIMAAVGCWICISWSRQLPSLVILIWPAPPTSLLESFLHLVGALGSEVALQHLLQTFSRVAVDHECANLFDVFGFGVHDLERGHLK